jgi:hypothetical protein
MSRGAAALLAGSLLVLGATACSSSSEPTMSTSAKSSTKGSSSDQKKPASAAKVGDTLALKGTIEGTEVDVTVVKIVDNAQGEDEFTTPDSGKRFVAVQFKFKNTGKKAYSDSPENGAKVFDAQGQSYDTDFNTTKAGPGFDGSVNVAPGDTALGFITFQLPKGVAIKKIQFGLDSGMSEQTGQWQVA